MSSLSAHSMSKRIFIILKARQTNDTWPEWKRNVFMPFMQKFVQQSYTFDSIDKRCGG